MDNVTETRLKLLENGYSPIKNRDKATYLKDWPQLELTEELIRSWDRNRRDQATGLRVENGLAAIDIDINDQDMVDALANAILDICPELDADDVPLLIRSSGRAKEAWFVRTDEPFGRIHTRRWIKEGETIEDGTHVLEIFGGASARQMGAFGPHTVERDGTVTRSYEWRDLSPLDVPLSALPVLTKQQFFAIADFAERLMEDAGWSPVLRTTSGENTTQRSYDLTDDMLFDLNDGRLGVSLNDLREYADSEEGLRCSASWLEGPDPKRSPDRCLISLTRGGYVSIWDSATGVTHVEAAAKPKDYGPEIDRAAEKLLELQERRKRKIKGGEECNVVVAKMLEMYAYCPTQQLSVVPIWATDLTAGVTVPAFRLQHMSNCMEEVGPRGGTKRINPVDMWMADARRHTVAGLRMRPDKPRPLFEEDGKTYVNTYSPPTFAEVGGDPMPGVGFLTQLLPDSAERQWFIKWLSFKLRYPHIPGPAVVMVAHSVFGTGRGTLGVLIGKLMGQQYVHSLSFEDFTGKTYQSQYNEWQAEALMLLVNESSEAIDGSVYQTKRNSYERLKEIVDPRATVRHIKVKGTGNYRSLSSTTVLIATNHADALPIPENDRRFAVLRNGGNSDPDYWRDLNSWMEDDANVSAFYQWLVAQDIEDYSPYEAPPMFAGKLRMVEDSKSDLEVGFDIVLESLASPYVTVAQIEHMMRDIERGNSLDYPRGDLGGIIKRLVRTNLHRVGVKDGPNWRPMFDGTRHPVYATSHEAAARGASSVGVWLQEQVTKNGPAGGGAKPGNVIDLAKIKRSPA